MTAILMTSNFMFEGKRQHNRTERGCYLSKKEGNVNGNGKSVLYRLWSANDDVDGIFNEDEDHLDGDTVYTIRIEFNDIEKSGNSYTVNLSYFLYDGTTLLKPGIESRVEFDHLSNSSDVFFEQDEDLFDLNCRPSSRPEPNPEPEFSVPDNVCESFPEPIQGWKQSQSKLVVTNKEVRITGWSDEYLADSQNYYTYKQDWENGSEWSTLRIGFDKGAKLGNFIKTQIQRFVTMLWAVSLEMVSQGMAVWQATMV